MSNLCCAISDAHHQDSSLDLPVARQPILLKATELARPLQRRNLPRSIGTTRLDSLIGSSLTTSRQTSGQSGVGELRYIFDSIGGDATRQALSRRSVRSASPRSIAKRLRSRLLRKSKLQISTPFPQSEEGSVDLNTSGRRSKLTKRRSSVIATGRKSWIPLAKKNNKGTAQDLQRELTTTQPLLFRNIDDDFDSDPSLINDQRALKTPSKLSSRVVSSQPEFGRSGTVVRAFDQPEAPFQVKRIIHPDSRQFSSISKQPTIELDELSTAVAQPDPVGSHGCRFNLSELNQTANIHQNNYTRIKHSNPLNSKDADNGIGVSPTESMLEAPHSRRSHLYNQSQRSRMRETGSNDHARKVSQDSNIALAVATLVEGLPSFDSELDSDVSRYQSISSQLYETCASRIPKPPSKSQTRITELSEQTVTDAPNSESNHAGGSDNDQIAVSNKPESESKQPRSSTTIQSLLVNPCIQLDDASNNYSTSASHFRSMSSSGSSLHLHKMRISQHLRSISSLSDVSSAAAATLTQPFEAFASYTSQPIHQVSKSLDFQAAPLHRDSVHISANTDERNVEDEPQRRRTLEKHQSSHESTKNFQGIDAVVLKDFTNGDVASESERHAYRRTKISVTGEGEINAVHINSDHALEATENEQPKSTEMDQFEKSSSKSRESHKATKSRIGIIGLAKKLHSPARKSVAKGETISMKLAPHLDGPTESLQPRLSDISTVSVSDNMDEATAVWEKALRLHQAQHDHHQQNFQGHKGWKHVGVSSSAKADSKGPRKPSNTSTESGQDPLSSRKGMLDVKGATFQPLELKRINTSHSFSKLPIPGRQPSLSETSHNAYNKDSIEMQNELHVDNTRQTSWRMGRLSHQSNSQSVSCSPTCPEMLENHASPKDFLFSRRLSNQGGVALPEITVTSEDASSEKKMVKPRRIRPKSTLKAWSRYPSHTRRERSLSAGVLDNISTRDFAPISTISTAIDDLVTDGNSSQHDKAAKRTKARVRSMVLKRKLKEIPLLFKSRSVIGTKGVERGHRSSIAPGGQLEYPELELLPYREPRLPAAVDFSHLPDDRDSESDAGQQSDSERKREIIEGKQKMQATEQRKDKSDDLVAIPISRYRFTSSDYSHERESSQEYGCTLPLFTQSDCNTKYSAATDTDKDHEATERLGVQRVVCGAAAANDDMMDRSRMLGAAYQQILGSYGSSGDASADQSSREEERSIIRRSTQDLCQRLDTEERAFLAGLQEEE